MQWPTSLTATLEMIFVFHVPSQYIFILFLFFSGKMISTIHAEPKII